jgi:PAS domain S-box-containing protein
MRPLLPLQKRLTIQSRLVVYYTSFALITLLTVIYFSYTQAVQSLRSSVDDKLSTVAALKIDSLHQWMDEQQRNAIFLGSLPELREMSGELLSAGFTENERSTAHDALKELLTIIVQRTADFQDIQIMDLKGNIVISLIPGLTGKSQADRPFFTQGLTKTFTQAFYKSDLLGRTTLTVSTPLFDGSQKRVGVLALHFNMKRVDDIFRKDMPMNEAVHTYFFNSNFEIITDDPLTLAETQTPESYSAFSGLKGGQGSATYVNHMGVNVIGKYFLLEDQNTAVVVEIDEKTALWPAERLAINIALIGILVYVLLVLIVIVVARRITAPLRALSETVSRISAGELDATAPDNEDDEVGALARAFNVMTNTLRQTLADMQEELSERKVAQDELLQFRKVMDESNDAIYMIDPETSRYIDFNRNAHERLGYTREELNQLGVLDIATHVQDISEWHHRVELVQEKGELIFETIYCRKDGTAFPVEVSATMLDYGEKNIMVASVRDITERKQTEAALRESEERFRKVFQSSPVAICITTLKEGRLLDANYAYWDLTGYDPNNSLGRDAVELKMWDVPEARLEFTQELKQKKSHFNADDYFYHTDGSLKQVISFYELIQINHEDCILAMFYDMSVQKKTMHALQQSEARIRALLNAFPDMIMELSADGVIISISPPKGMETITPPDRLIGQHVRVLFPRTVVAQITFSIQRAVESNQMNVFEFEMDMAGTHRAMEARLLASSSATVLMLVRDITQRKWIETEREKLIRELEIRNEESETLRESLASIVGTFEFSEIVQRIMFQIRRVIPYDTASIWKVDGDRQLIIGGVDLPPEIEVPNTIFVVNENNSAYPILKGLVPYVLNHNVQEELADFQMEPHTYVQSWLAIPLKTRGKVIGLIALDGRRKNQFNEHHAALAVAFANQVAIALENAGLFSELEIELGLKKNLITELENKNAELERFTYTVSHDLKSPLFTIRGFLGYLTQDALSGNIERLQGDIQRITDATEKMQRLLNELLELSRIGRLQNDYTNFPFEEVAREAVELVQGRIMERSIAIEIQPGMSTVFADRPRLLEVVQNLVDNACKFMGDNREPRIEIGQAGEDAETGKPIFYVRDNGIGIAPEHYDRVFGLFNKLDPRSDGTGIGLALVKRIIEVHGGRIWVKSEAGKGSAFFFTVHQQDRGSNG